jgi:hypothetical protein
MRQSALRPVAAAFVALGLALPWAASSPAPARAETFSVANSDHRNYLYFQVPEATARRALPDGWQAVPAQSGPAQGANLVVILIDQLAAHDAQGAPAGGGTNQLAVLAVPARNAATGAEGLMVFSGFSARPEGSPGAYGVYAPAEVRVERALRAGPGGERRGEERWTVAAEGGGGSDRLEVRLRFGAAAPVRTAYEARVYSARNPDFFRIYRVVQGNDFVRSGPAGVDRVEEFAFAASGPRLGALFDGSERLVAILSVPSYVRQVFLP